MRLRLVKTAVFVLLATLLLQIVFYQFQRIDSQKAVGVVQAILRDEAALINPQRIAQTLLDLRDSRFVSCITLARDGDLEPFLNNSKDSSCSRSSLWLNGQEVHHRVSSIDGKTWWISFRTINPPVFTTTLWVSRLLAILGIILLFSWLSSREKLHSKLLAVERDKAEFAECLARQVSHDIRSPLSAINMVVRAISSATAEQRTLLDQSVARINGIATDLLHRSRASSEKLSLLDGVRRGPGNMAKVVLIPTRPSSILQKIANEKSILLINKPQVRLILDLPDETECACNLDEKELTRALSNLINNSIEALQSPGTITLALRASASEVTIIVSDTGKGIPESILKRLGKEKVTFGKEGTKSGSGLGIYHAKSVVETMTGKFLIQSREGVGTMVTMRFPRLDSDTESAS